VAVAVALVVLVVRLALGDQRLELAEHVALHVGVGILVDGDAGRGVRDVDDDEPADEPRREDLLDHRSDVDHLRPGAGGEP
jgi:hypothetical protein